jgi:hypothetical protein
VVVIDNQDEFCGDEGCRRNSLARRLDRVPMVVGHAVLFCHPQILRQIVTPSAGKCKPPLSQRTKQTAPAKIDNTAALKRPQVFVDLLKINK